jgi:hypothetical protein
VIGGNSNEVAIRQDVIESLVRKVKCCRFFEFSLSILATAY